MHDHQPSTLLLRRNILTELGLTKPLWLPPQKKAFTAKQVYWRDHMMLLTRLPVQNVDDFVTLSPLGGVNLDGVVD